LSRAFAFGADTEPRPGQATARLRLAFLAPLLGALLLLVGVWALVLHVHERDMLEDEVERERLLVERIYRNEIGHKASVLRAAMEVFRHEPRLRAALAGRDRARLLALAAPVFAKLKAQHGITHFYFINPDRTVLLRVYRPERHGDVVERFTLREAERTGTAAYGVELGRHGTLTLRLVEPWYDNGRRRGFVELGMEIDQVLQKVQDFARLPMFVLISKEFLARADWEAGMKMLGRTPNWDRFPDAVLSVQASEQMPEALAERAARGLPALDVTQAHTHYRALFLPLSDAAGRRVGQLVALADVSAHVAESRRVVHLGATLGAVIAVVLFGFFYWLVGRIGGQLERYEQALRERATHDGLTGLYNHRAFHALLAEETTRTDRFGRQCSLLMLDIDHFKRVNDTHGHEAGDAILKGLGALLARQARAIDRVCRYGGEEFTVILPETDARAAAGIAERLRAAIEREPFDIGGGERISITASIGVASYPSEVDSRAKLAAAADSALYAAKQAGRNRVCRYEKDMAAGAAKQGRNG
jgi:diguanylate cyclase (GGDEF)-like protein